MHPLPKRVIPIHAESPGIGHKGAKYDCHKCPAYCCSYPLIEVHKRDIARLAKHFGLSYEKAEARFTKYDKPEKTRALRHQQDEHFSSVCIFLDRKRASAPSTTRAPACAASTRTRSAAATGIS